MTLSERIYNFYGGLGEDERAFIDGFESRYSEEEKERLFKEITTKRNKRLGAPDVSFFEYIFKVQKPKNSKRYFWAVCAECKGEYWYTLPFCPHCWKNGLKCDTRSVRISDERPPANVLRLNKEYTCGAETGCELTGEKICYDCSEQELSFCYDFGKPSPNCDRNKWEYCKCRECCAKARMNNAKWDMQTEKKTLSFAVPFRKVG